MTSSIRMYDTRPLLALNGSPSAVRLFRAVWMCVLLEHAFHVVAQRQTPLCSQLNQGFMQGGAYTQIYALVPSNKSAKGDVLGHAKYPHGR